MRLAKYPAAAAAMAVLFSPLVGFAAGAITQITNDGAWTWFNDPRAIVDGNTLVSGWMTLSGHVMVGRTDLSTGVTTTADLYGQFFQSDDHDNPAFLKNPDGSYTAYFAPHGGASVRVRNFTIDATTGAITLGSLTTLNESSQVSGSSGWTYANPYRLSAENKTYLFSRGPNFNPVVRTRDDSTGNWGIASTLVSNPNQRPYVKYESNNVDRIGFTFTDAHPRNVDNNVYYAYLKNGSYWRADGTKIKDVSAGAITPADMSGSVGTVFNHLANPAVTGDNSWVWDIATDKTGHPVIAYTTFPSDTQHQYHWARWDGAKWDDKTMIANAGPYIGDAAEANYSAGIALDHTDPTITYVSWMNAGTWNLQQWKLNDDNKTWASELIANGFGPADENVRPYVPLNRPANTEMVMWLRGQYDYWNLSKGVGYATSVQLWTKTTGSLTGDGSGASVPEPGGAALAGLAVLSISRRSRRSSSRSMAVPAMPLPAR